MAIGFVASIIRTEKSVSLKSFNERQKKNQGPKKATRAKALVGLQVKKEPPTPYTGSPKLNISAFLVKAVCKRECGHSSSQHTSECVEALQCHSNYLAGNLCKEAGFYENEFQMDPEQNTYEIKASPRKAVTKADERSEIEHNHRKARAEKIKSLLLKHNQGYQKLVNEISAGKEKGEFRFLIFVQCDDETKILLTDEIEIKKTGKKRKHSTTTFTDQAWQHPIDPQSLCMARQTNNSPNRVLMDGKTMNENPKMVKKFLKETPWKKLRIEKHSSSNTQKVGSSLGRTFVSSIGPPTVDDTIFAKCGQCAVTNDDYNTLFQLGKLTRNMIDFTLTRLSRTTNTQTLVLSNQIWPKILDGNARDFDFVEDELCLENDFSSYKYILGAHIKNNYSRLIWVNLEKKILHVLDSRQCTESVDINGLLNYFEKRNRVCDEQIPTNGWEAEYYFVEGKHCEYPSEFSTIMFAEEIMGIKHDFLQSLDTECQKIVFDTYYYYYKVTFQENEVQNITEKTMNQNQNDNIPITEVMQYTEQPGPSSFIGAPSSVTTEMNREDPASEMDSKEDDIYGPGVSNDHSPALCDQLGEPTNQYNPESSQMLESVIGATSSDTPETNIEDPVSEMEKDSEEDGGAEYYGPQISQVFEEVTNLNPSIFETEENSTLQNAETALAGKQEDNTQKTEELEDPLKFTRCYRCGGLLQVKIDKEICFCLCCDLPNSWKL